MPTTPGKPATVRTAERREAAAAELNTGRRVDAEHAVELAHALLEIAAMAMPDTYYANDARCRLARAVIAAARQGAR